MILSEVVVVVAVVGDNDSNGGGCIQTVFVKKIFQSFPNNDAKDVVDGEDDDNNSDDSLWCC